MLPLSKIEILHVTHLDGAPISIVLSLSTAYSKGLPKVEQKAAVCYLEEFGRRMHHHQYQPLAFLISSNGPRPHILGATGWALFRSVG